MQRTGLHRRAVMGLFAAIAAMVPAIGRARRADKEKAVSLICHIRYEIDPYKQDQFESYARKWLTAIPAAGGDLIGYFMPAEGTNYVAHAMIGFESLAAYEAYRAKLRQNADSRANFEFAQKEKFILREEREFLRQVTA